MLRAARVTVPMVAKASPNQGSIETREALTPLFGACLLSSVGSLPLHLAPLIVATLIADSRVSVAGAGWVPSIMLLGQLSTSIALPILRMHHVGRIAAIVVAIFLLIGFGISSSTDFSRALLGWFLVGQCCGVLMYLGAIAASASSRLIFAFSLRLAIVLILAGSVSGVLQMNAAFISYNGLLSQLVLILVPILVCGLVMYRPTGESRATIENAPGGTWTVGQLSGLAAIYFLFVGLTGFLAYVVQQALTRGMIFEDMVWSIAAMKVATGIWLLSTAMIEDQRRENDRFFHHALVLALAIVVVFHSHNVIVFFAGLLIFELAFNSLSTRIKAAVVAAGPQFSGPWLTGVILLGAATGPVLNGCAIGLGLEGAFILLSILSAFGPLLWQRFGGPGVKSL